METDAPGPASAGRSTHCPYCALQCGLRLGGAGGAEATATGDPDCEVNRGLLCVKGYTSPDTLAHPERLPQPLLRNARGVLVPASWDAALDRTARALRDVQARHGRDAVGLLGSGALTNEKAYLLGKLARVALRTANIDYNGRFCMASAAAAAQRALGIDRGLPFPLADLARAEVLVLVGANVLETLPPVAQYLDAQRRAGGRLVVVDPRATPTARASSLHLALLPGSDAALANGLLHLLVREGRVDRGYIEARTEGFERIGPLVAQYWPGRAEQLTGIPLAQLEATAALLGGARTVMILSGRGAEQQEHGVGNDLAWINVALALGMVGRPGAGWGALTGQGNGQGGREHGQKNDQLPGGRSLRDPEARRTVARYWGVPEASLPGPGLAAGEMLASLGRAGGVRALLVVGTNPAVSAPDLRQVLRGLRALDFLAVADFFPSETAALADVVLPVAQWAEEEGTVTNLEGRVLLRRRAFAPPPGVRTDLEWIVALAGRLGFADKFPSADARDVFDELRGASAGGPVDYAGITRERIGREGGVYWPCPEAGHPGTPRLFAGGFPTASGRARFHAVHHQPPGEVPDEGYPLYLTTGRLLAQYQSGTQTRRVGRLAHLAPRPEVEVHPATARRHGLADGGRATLVTRRGRATFTVRLTARIREDTLFVPFHWGGAQAVNRLTSPAHDALSRMPSLKLCAVRLERADDREGEDIQ